MIEYDLQECPKDYRMPQAWRDIHELRQHIHELRAQNVLLTEALTVALSLLNRKNTIE